MYGAYKDSFDRNEYPSIIREMTVTKHSRHSAPAQMYSAHKAPLNEFEALMEELPLVTVTRLTEAEREAEWLVFQQKLDGAGLDDRERLVVDCIVFGGMSLVETAQFLARDQGRNKPLSKMQISRIRDAAYAKLRGVFDV